jgi:hypothetical protein
VPSTVGTAVQEVHHDSNQEASMRYYPMDVSEWVSRNGRTMFSTFGYNTEIDEARGRAYRRPPKRRILEATNPVDYECPHERGED